MNATTTRKGTPTMPKVRSLAELRILSAQDARYKRLAIIAARNIGGEIKDDDREGALRWLELCAADTTESGVVGEVNFVRDLAEKQS